MPAQAAHRCAQRPQREHIARREHRRQGAILGGRAVVAFAEDQRGKVPNVFGIERASLCEAHFDIPSTRDMHAAKARGQRRRIVGDDEIAT
jgi:hypothetical protein